MTITTKILLILLAITLLGSFGFIVYKENQFSAQQEAVNKSMTEFKQLQDDIARSSTQYATKDDLINFAKQNQINLDSITKDLSSLNANLTGINHISVSSIGTNLNNIPSTHTAPNQNQITLPTVNCDGKQIPCPNLDQFGYLNNKQELELNEHFDSANVPLGAVGFSAWNKNPWDLTILPRTYNITNVLGTDENDRHYIYNKFSINTNGKDYPVQINNAKYMEEYPTPSFSFTNARLYLGADAGVGVSKMPIAGEFVPGIHFGMISYGNNKLAPDWSFAEVGVGYAAVSKNLQIQVSPIQYNIGKNISFVKNTYIGPSVGFNTDGNVMIGAGIRVGL